MGSEGESTTSVDREWIWGIAKQLQEEDRVSVETGSNKDRTLTVVDEARYVEREPYRCNGLLLTFEGYGTEYTLEVPENDQPVRLLYPSNDGIGELVHGIDFADEEESFAIVAEHTAADLGVPER